ncbi:hypothetical protein H0H87_005539 [Tephrocybe sp. NHM501043]|nr:hypothetical protein H0H87_005539 [Tephrocybe sp. NHM501043]
MICTLMANSPNGDIEMLLTAAIPQNEVHTDSPSLRVSLSRRNKIIEIARHISGAEGEEWKKRTVAAIPQPPYVSTTTWKYLEQDEKEALHHATLFVRISDTVEETMSAAPLQPSPITPLADEGNEEFEPVEPNTPVQSCSPSRKPTITSSFSSFSFPPRPSKLSTAISALLTPEPTLDLPEDPLKDCQVSKADAVISDRTKLSWREDMHIISGCQGIQTRFIPSVGWCIRYASSVSQGGRYRLMFFDGVTLDIDVDEEWVEFKSQSGETTM